MRKRMRILGVTVVSSLAVATVPLLTSTDAQAAHFTGGNLVVYRVGDGAAPLSNAAARVYLDEFSPTGSPVQSLGLPTAAADGNRPLTASGQSRSEGLIAGSSDGRFVTVTGYAAAPGATGPGGISLTGSDPATVARVVGLVDANGTIDTSTGLTSASSPAIIRSAATTDGNRLWATGGNGGIATTTLGSTTTTTVAGAASSNLNSLTLQDGQLFASGILSDRLAAVGTGAPATSASLTDVAGLPDNLLSYGYSFVDLTTAGYAGTTLDTLYLANASERGGTVDKYRFDGTSWTRIGYVDVEGAFGLVTDLDGSSVSIAVTTPTKLLSLTDTGAAGTTFAPGAPSVLATAAANTEFRGVALAPTAAAGPSVFVRKPSTGTAVSLAGGTVAVSAYVDSPDGVASVKAKIGTGAFVTATKGAGKVWTASIPATTFKAGASTLTVSATDQAGTPATATVTRAITLTGSAVPAGSFGPGTFAWSVKLVKRTGTWKAYAAAASPTKKGLTSAKKGNKLTLKAYGKGLVLTFGRAPNAGKITVKVDGKATTIDLYAKKKANLKKTWTFAGAVKSHTVIVTVLGTKNAKSKGKAAFLAALQVKP